MKNGVKFQFPLEKINSGEIPDLENNTNSISDEFLKCFFLNEMFHLKNLQRSLEHQSVEDERFFDAYKGNIRKVEYLENLFKNKSVKTLCLDKILDPIGCLLILQWEYAFKNKISLYDMKFVLKRCKFNEEAKTEGLKISGLIIKNGFFYLKKSKKKINFRSY